MQSRQNQQQMTTTQERVSVSHPCAGACGLRFGNGPLPFVRCGVCASHFCHDCLANPQAHPCRRDENRPGNQTVATCPDCGEPVTEGTVGKRRDWERCGDPELWDRFQALQRALRAARDRRTEVVDRVRGEAAEKRAAYGASWSGWTREQDDDLAIARNADPQLCQAIDRLENVSQNLIQRVHRLACTPASAARRGP